MAVIFSRPLTVLVGIMVAAGLTLALPAQSTTKPQSSGLVAAENTLRGKGPTVQLIANSKPNGCGAYSALCEGSRLTGNVVKGVGTATTKCAEEATIGVVGDALGMTKGSKWDRLKKAGKTLGKRAGAPGLALSCANSLR